MAGVLTAPISEFARYKLDIVGVQEVKWDEEDTVRTKYYKLFYEK